MKAQQHKTQLSPNSPAFCSSYASVRASYAVVMGPLHCHLDFAVQILSQMLKQPTPVAAVFFFPLLWAVLSQEIKHYWFGNLSSTQCLRKDYCLFALFAPCVFIGSKCANWHNKYSFFSPLSCLSSPLQAAQWRTESRWNTSEIFSVGLAFGSCFIQSQYWNEECTCVKNTDTLRGLGRESSHQFALCSWIMNPSAASCAVVKAARLVRGRQPLVLGRQYFSSRDGLSKVTRLLFFPTVPLSACFFRVFSSHCKVSFYNENHQRLCEIWRCWKICFLPLWRIYQ